MFAIAFTLISAVDMGEQKIYVVKGNQAKEPLEIVFNRYFCSQDRVVDTDIFQRNKRSDLTVTPIF